MPAKKPLRPKRPLFYTLVYGIIGLALLLSLLPQFAAQAMRLGLPQLGVGVVEVGNIDINLFQGRVAVDDLRFYRSAAQVLHLSHGELEFDWRALLQKRLQIRQLTLQGFSLTISQSSQAPLRIAGFAFPEADNTPPAPQQDAGSGWGFGIDRLALRDNQLHLIRPGLVVTLGIQQFEVGTLKSWEGESATPMQALLLLNDSRLQLDASATPFAAAPGISLKLNLSPLQLATAQPLLPAAAGTLSGQLSAELELELKQEQETLSLAQSGTLGLQQLRLEQTGMLVQAGALDWHGSSELQLTAEGTRISLDGGLNNNQLTLQLADTLISNRDTQWQGLTTVQLTPGATRIGVDGQLDVGSLKLQQAGTEAGSGPLAWQGKVDLQLGAESLRAGLKGKLEGNGLAFTAEDLDASGSRLTWQGDAELLQNGEKLQGSLNGELSSEALSAHLVTSDTTFSGETLNWQGGTELQRDAESLRTSLDGKLSAGGLSARVASNDLAFGGQTLNWQGSATSTIDDALDIRSEAALRLDNISLGTLDSETPHTTLQRLELPRLRLQGTEQILLGDIALTGLQSRLRLTPEGMLPLQQHLPAADNEPAPASDTAAAEKGTAARLRIDGIKLSGNSTLQFEDTTLTPRFSETLTLTALNIGAIDTAAPSRLTPLDVQARVGGHSELALKGNAAPLLSPPELDIEANLQDYEMPPLTPYLVRLLGYRINSGQLDNKLVLKINNGMLEGETRLKARQLEVEAEDADRIAEFEQKTTMPVGTALSVLRDKQGDIALTIPFSGSLDDPKFNFQDALNTAMAKALRSASVSYLKYLLQPYGNLITLVQLAGQVGGTIQLDPVLFVAGSAEPPAESDEYLLRIAGLLADKKSLQLRLCGIATVSDLKAMSKGKESVIPPGPHEELEQLARQRAETLKQRLVDEHQLDPGRLFVCNPELQRDEQAQPRVRLQL